MKAFFLRHSYALLLKSETVDPYSMHRSLMLLGTIWNHHQQRNVTQYILQLHGFLQSGTLEQTIRSHYLEEIKAYEKLLPKYILGS